MFAATGICSAPIGDPMDHASRPKPAAEPIAGWRGHVTLLFADLCDYTALNEVCDPEDTVRLRHQVERQRQPSSSAMAGP